MAAPTKTLFGYLDGVGEVDAVAYARGFAERRLDSAPEHCWYAVAPYGAGYLYEVQEGGTGRSYMPGLLDALRHDPNGRALIPCGAKVFELSLRQGRPSGVLLSDAAGVRLLKLMRSLEEGGSEARPAGHLLPAVAGALPLPILATRRMRPVRRTGTALFVSGLVAMLIGSAVFTGGGMAWLSAGKAGLSPVTWSIDDLPHRQWGRALASAWGPAYVARLEYAEGRWSTTTAVATAAPSPTAPSTAPNARQPSAQSARQPAAPPRHLTNRRDGRAFVELFR